MVTDTTAAEIERRRAEEAEAESADIDRTPVRTYWQLVRQRFMKHRLAVFAVIVLIVLATYAVVVPTVTGNAWRETQLFRDDAPPELFDEDGEFTFAVFGYNEIGQNLFARLGKATQTSLTIGLAAVVIIVVIGIFIGSIAGYVGGWLDNLLMRFVDIMLSLPGLFVILMITAFFGQGNVWVIVFAIGLTGWTTAARLVRAEFLSLRDVDYVQAARALGASPQRIILRHMLPPAMAPIVVAATLGIADSVVVESALSFLGFGIGGEGASLGTMLQNAQNYFFSGPLKVLYPGVVLILIVLSASFLGDGLRDALDPRQRVDK
ncbi:MAG: ABC transporter permease [Chloroflexota bacterium]|nr:ABC transporter permease [Chloroflexota bacterium]